MKKLLLTSFFLILSFGLRGQSSENPWQISLGLTNPSILSDITNRNGTVNSNDFSGSVGVAQAGLYRKILGGLSIGGQVSLAKARNEATSTDYDFFSMHTGLKYGFNIDGRFSPYVKAGVYGSTSLKDGTDSGSLNTDYSNFGSVGVDLSFGGKFGAFAEYSFGRINENPDVDYSLISAGLTYGFGSGDADKDGIPDKKDKCPDVPGLKEFEGCPDTDGDGLPDNEDDCPEEAGPVENKGCPDTDGDGVLDKDDACPEVAGLEALNGCPDSDEDGVADPDDDCPEEAGPSENNGCPWPDQDGDGIPDKDDACPEEAGTTANGCPEVAKEVLNALNAAGINILFPADSYKLMGKKVLTALEQVKTILNENPEGVVLIQGHASEDGSTEYNLELSRKRAESAKAKLIELGIDAARLEVEAFGEQQPIGDNSTTEGRVKSRRVEFKAKQ